MFNHGNESIHDAEIAGGADAALCRLLSFLLFKEIDELGENTMQSHDTIGEASGTTPRVEAEVYGEIRSTCQLVEMIYRCSKEKVEESFKKIGSEFLPLLNHILVNEMKRQSMKEHGPSDVKAPKAAEIVDVPGSASTETCMRFATKILSHFARVQSATIAMAHDQRLLSLLLNLVKFPMDDVPFEAQHSALWILANIACNNENSQQLIASNDGLMDALSLIANYELAGDEDHRKQVTWSYYYQALRLQCTAFRFILNLSWAKENKTLLLENNDLLTALGRAMTVRASPWIGNACAINKILLQTRRFAVGALRNIASTTPQQKYCLCQFQNGFLLNSLCDVTQNENDSIVRDKAFAVIFNLSCTDTKVT